MLFLSDFDSNFVVCAVANKVSTVISILWCTSLWYIVDWASGKWQDSCCQG